MTKEQTSSLFAHRLSTIRDSDVIVAIADGRRVDVGHDELMKAGGFPRSVHESVPRRRDTR
jgi:ATP-binding cassette subfamily B protein